MMLVRRLDSNHDMTFGRGLANFARDAEATAQSVDTRLQLLGGEWFLDTDAGVPYLQKITVKPANQPLAEALIKRAILKTDGVAGINSFTLNLDGQTRRLNIQANVSTVYGSTETIRVTPT